MKFYRKSMKIKFVIDSAILLTAEGKKYFEKSS